MKFAWHNNIEDLAMWNLAQVEVIDIEEFEELLAVDLYADELDTPEDKLIIEVIGHLYRLVTQNTH